MFWLLQIFDCTVGLKEGNNLDSSLCSKSYFTVSTSLICFTENLIGFFQLYKKIEDFFSSPASEPQESETPGTSKQN